MADIVPAVDISNYQGDLKQHHFDEFKREGVQTVICGTDGSDEAPVAIQRQVAMARNAGLRIEAYIFMYHPPYVPDMMRRTDIKLDLIDSIGGIERVWIDCEHQLPWDSNSIHNCIVGIRDKIEGRGYKTGIYTNRYWWIERTGVNREFNYLPLWLANYDGVYELDISSRPLSGWTKLHRKQLSDKAVVGGYSPLDLDIEERIEIVIPTPEPPQPTTDPRITEAISKLEEAWRILKEI